MEPEGAWHEAAAPEGVVAGVWQVRRRVGGADPLMPGVPTGWRGRWVLERLARHQERVNATVNIGHLHKGTQNMVERARDCALPRDGVNLELRPSFAAQSQSHAFHFYLLAYLFILFAYL